MTALTRWATGPLLLVAISLHAAPQQAAMPAAERLSARAFTLGVLPTTQPSAPALQLKAASRAVDRGQHGLWATAASLHGASLAACDLPDSVFHDGFEDNPT